MTGKNEYFSTHPGTILCKQLKTKIKEARNE